MGFMCLRLFLLVSIFLSAVFEEQTSGLLVVKKYSLRSNLTFELLIDVAVTCLKPLMVPAELIA